MVREGATRSTRSLTTQGFYPRLPALPRRSLFVLRFLRRSTSQRLQRRSTVRSLSPHLGVPPRMAPEMLRGERIGEAADVYSYGVVLWELLSPGLPPWGEHHAMQARGVVLLLSTVLCCGCAVLLVVPDPVFVTPLPLHSSSSSPPIIPTCRWLGWLGTAKRGSRSHLGVTLSWCVRDSRIGPTY